LLLQLVKSPKQSGLLVNRLGSRTNISTKSPNHLGYLINHLAKPLNLFSRLFRRLAKSPKT